MVDLERISHAERLASLRLFEKVGVPPTGTVWT
jgi:hypothetical protein